MPFSLRLPALLGVLCFAFAAAAAASNEAGTIWRLLDYVAVDYREAIADGQIINAAEYAEMEEFTATIRRRIQALPPTPAQPALLASADALIGLVVARATPETVAQSARALAERLLEGYPVPLAPSSPPDVGRGEALYAQQCASCHGVAGAGDGLAAPGMEPPPIDFTDAARAGERSVFALYQVIEQGLEETPMVSYAHLPAADRWALAFHVGQYAYPQALAAEGERLWREDASLRARFGSLEQLVRVTPAELAQAVGDAPARALTAYLRRHPEAVQPANTGGGLQIARERLARSVEAYAAGDRRAATDLALSAYLDGFEPVEPLLAARDSPLMARVEEAMLELRARIGRAAPVEEIRAQADVVAAAFDEVDAALAPDESGAVTAFVGALTILVREGLEAMLIVIAIIAFLRKAQRSDAMPYVHAGWIGALIAGAVTWAIATYAISISGAQREVTEGLAALFAALVLISVGLWMHQKSLAGRWQQYLKERMSSALSKRSLWFLFALCFVAVYREVFETILFYAAIWSQGHGTAILAGFAVGALLLALIAWAMLRFTRRLPIGRFFAVSSALIAVLAVVLTGKGVAALQEAGWIGVHPIAVPRIDWLGVSPSLEVVGAQAAVLLILLAGFAYNRMSARAAST